MRAFAFQQQGGPEVLNEIILPIPTELQPRDILVKNKGASVNPVDLKRMKGSSYHKVTLDTPLVVGNDAAGVVIKVGSEVTKFKGIVLFVDK
jgi:NADPH:quinone reductase-like Zn-dependent oxidoreductase